MNHYEKEYLQQNIFRRPFSIDVLQSHILP